MQKIIGECDEFCVYHWMPLAHALRAKLMKLTKPSCLRPIMAEHGTKIPPFHWLGQCLESVIDVCARNCGSIFRTQANPSAICIFKYIHFFLYHIRSTAERSDKQRCLLQYRRFHVIKSVCFSNCFGRMAYCLPYLALMRQNILHTAKECYFFALVLWFRNFFSRGNILLFHRRLDTLFHWPFAWRVHTFFSWHTKILNYKLYSG